MNRKITAAAATAALAVTLAGCGHHPSEAACKGAMQALYAHVLTNPNAGQVTEPSACKGLPDNVLTRIAADVLDGK